MATDYIMEVNVMKYQHTLCSKYGRCYVDVDCDVDGTYALALTSGRGRPMARSNQNKLFAQRAFKRVSDANYSRRM
jgi:hypothetical protein